jgi:transposase-like protein
MTTRRRFSSDFKANVALEALRGDKTIEEVASNRKVHPNQVSAWKRRAAEGLGAVFSNGAEGAGRDRDAEVRDLHAKIGELTVERDFLARGLKR